MSAFIKDIVEAGIRGRMTNDELIAANPHRKASSIERIANRRRKELGITSEAVAYSKPLKLPRDLQEELRLEAVARDPGSTANRLAIQILSIIVQDRLFNAILGEPA